MSNDGRICSENVLCFANILKIGRKTAYGTAECRSGASDLLAHHVLTYAAFARGDVPTVLGALRPLLDLTLATSA